MCRWCRSGIAASPGSGNVRLPMAPADVPSRPAVDAGEMSSACPRHWAFRSADDMQAARQPV